MPDNLDHDHPDIAEPIPPDPHRGPGGVGPLDTTSDTVPYLGLLTGPWVTSHAGFLQNTSAIADPFAPPQTGGYDVSYAADGIPNAFLQR